MKQYKILCESLTCYGNKRMYRGEVHWENQFPGAHIDELLANGSIEEYVDEPANKEEEPAKEEPVYEAKEETPINPEED